VLRRWGGCYPDAVELTKLPGWMSKYSSERGYPLASTVLGDVWVLETRSLGPEGSETTTMPFLKRLRAPATTLSGVSNCSSGRMITLQTKLLRTP